MNVSIMLRDVYENPNETIKLLMPHQSAAIWIPSKNIVCCYACKTEFTLWKRKHHCRACGRVFCHTCADNWGNIPSLVGIRSPSLKSFSIYSKIYSEKRMCYGCKDNIEFIEKSSDYLKIFSNLPVSICDLPKLLSVNKMWCKTISTILSFYKNIQYKLPYECFTKIEKNILRTHKLEFKGHFNFISKYVLSCDDGEKFNKLINYYVDNNKNKTCVELCCASLCQPKPNIEDLLYICENKYLFKNETAMKWIYDILCGYNLYELKILMPWLLHLCIKNYRFGEEYIINLCSKNIDLIYAFFFECKFNMIDTIIERKLGGVFNKFLEIIGEKNKKELYKTVDFIEYVNFNLMEKIKKTYIDKNIHDWFQKNNGVLMPWDPNIVCCGLMIEGLYRFNSATRPWKVPLIVKTTGGEKIINILIKFEDVRKDKLTMIVANYIGNICREEVNITIYNVLPITPQLGWIEMVEECNTLYDIKHKYNSTLQNYIMDLNPDVKVIEMRERFIKTCVSSCVLCYVLGVGDRHLENILVTRKGDLLHIDFSYILGEDPKRLSEEMKITNDMLLMLGGYESRIFKEFKQKCKKAYEKIRARPILWYLLLTYLEFSVPSIDNYKYTDDLIKNHVIERLLPGGDDVEASTQIIEILERSSKSTWGQSLTDWSHTIGNGFRNMKLNFFNKEDEGMFDMEL